MSGADPQALQEVLELIAGNVIAFRSIIAKYSDSLSTIAMILTRSPDLAREAVQDAFVRLWESRSTLDPALGVHGYLKTVTRRRAIDLLRHERMHTRIVDTLKRYENPTEGVGYNAGEAAVESSDLQKQVLAAIGELPLRCREIFLLNRQGGFTYAQIAETLGISVGTVRNQMSQATQRLALVVARWRAGESSKP